MIAGVTDTNWILLVAGMATVIVALAVAPVTDAVIVSVPEAQPLSLYVEVAVPKIVVTGEVSVAKSSPTQGEVKATEIGIVASTLFIYTGILTMLLP